MASQNFGLSIAVEDIFRIARESGLTMNGEIFSVKWMAELASKSLKVRSILLRNDADHPKDTLKSMITSLLDGDLILIPYDADKNNEPSCSQGHSSHWSIIIGFIAPSYDNLQHSNFFAPDSSFSDLFWLIHDQNCSNQFENICIEDTYFIAAHGKSKHYNLWKGLNLLSSNDQLTDFCPNRAQDGLIYILPENGVKELQKAMVILKSK